MAVNHAGGKGCRRRRSEVSDEKIADNWELAFGKKDKKSNEAAKEEQAAQTEARHSQSEKINNT